MLGQSVANLVSVFNPSMIILSGEGVRAGGRWLSRRLSRERAERGVVVDQ